MNIFRDAGLWLIGMLPQPAPDWAVGAAVIAGIWLVFVAMLAISGAMAWMLSRRSA